MRPLVKALSSLDLSDGICKFVCANINKLHLQTLKIGGDQILHKVPFLQQFFAVHTCTCSSNLFSTDYIFFSHFLLNKLYVLIFAFFLGTPGMSETKLEIQKKITNNFPQPFPGNSCNHLRFWISLPHPVCPRPGHKVQILWKIII